MKILYVITKSNMGGAQRYVLELAKAARERGHTVAVALGGDGPLTIHLKSFGIPTYSLASTKRNINFIEDLKSLFEIKKVISEFKPDCLHLNSPKVSGLGALLGRIYKVRNIIYTNHGWPFKEDRNLIQILIIKFFSWLTVFLAHTTIVLSEKERAMAHGWPFVQNKFSIIPNGTSPFFTFSKDESLSWLFGRDTSLMFEKEETLIVGTIAELHKNKGLSFAIEAIAELKDQNIIYCIIGEGEERQNLTKLIQEKKVADKVFLLGSFDEARKYLPAFDFFLLPSIKEGLPFVILEAGQAGVPVISTQVGGISELITNLETGLLITPGRSAAIRNSIIYAIDHVENMQEMARHLSHHIQRHYTFEQVFEQIDALYKSKS